MTLELLSILQQLHVTQLEKQLVMQCAPVLAGEKISNLLIIANHQNNELKELLKDIGFRYYRLLRDDKKTTYLIFHKEKLNQWLLNEEVQQVLKNYGYPDQRLGVLLLRFQMRYQKYSIEKQGFPHEMGLLLGYPVEDVIGFINHHGKKYLYAGYWKVYQDIDKKIKIFDRYETVKREQVTMLALGMNFNEMIRYYK